MTKSNLKTHLHENNKESQTHLEENEQKFSQQCLKVLELLNQGKRLTVLNAGGYGISSLPRRIKDLRDRNQVKNIIDEWVKDHKGKKLYKEWFIVVTTRPTKKSVVEKHSKHIQPKLL